MSTPATCAASPSAISSRALAFGVMPSGLPDGATTDLFGLVAALTAAPQGGAYAELPEGWPARFRCDSCDGNGEVGEPISMGHFQPPERERCPDCGGRGWCSEEAAFSADDMRDFADRTHALRASHGQAPAGATRADSRACYLCGHSADAHPMEPDPRGGMRRGACPAPTAQPAPAATPQADSVTAPAGGAVAGQAPGINALMCVISSLRDTAHFSDEEGELTNELRALRDWVVSLAAAPTPAAQAADSVLEDAALLEFKMRNGSAIDRVSKQGANHD